MITSISRVGPLVRRERGGGGGLGLMGPNEEKRKGEDEEQSPWTEEEEEELGDKGEEDEKKDKDEEDEKKDEEDEDEKKRKFAWMAWESLRRKQETEWEVLKIKHRHAKKKEKRAIERARQVLWRPKNKKKKRAKQTKRREQAMKTAVIERAKEAYWTSFADKMKLKQKVELKQKQKKKKDKKSEKKNEEKTKTTEKRMKYEENIGETEPGRKLTVKERLQKLMEESE